MIENCFGSAGRRIQADHRILLGNQIWILLGNQIWILLGNQIWILLGNQIWILLGNLIWIIWKLIRTNIIWHRVYLYQWLNNYYLNHLTSILIICWQSELNKLKKNTKFNLSLYFSFSTMHVVVYGGNWNELHTVKPLITNTSKEFIKCRILHFLIMECCRYLVS